MKKQINYSKLIDKYINGEITEDELKLFENELKINPQLKAELELHKKIDDAIINDDLANFNKRMKNIHSDYTSSKVVHKTNFIQKNIYYLVAAIIILFIAIASIVYFSNNKKLSNTEIYSMYFKPYETINKRSAETITNDDIYKEALRNYDKENYSKAIKLFSQLFEQDDSYMAAYLYAGISLMENNNFHEAEKSFQTIINNNNICYIQQAEWYLGLCYLKADKSKKAKKQFNKIVSRQGFYENKAKEILNKL
jgi:hypothetical protein